jgi:hypothetical protein
MSGAFAVFNSQWIGGIGVSSAGYGNTITVGDQFPDFPYELIVASTGEVFISFSGPGFLFNIIKLT